MSGFFSIQILYHAKRSEVDFIVQRLRRIAKWLQQQQLLLYQSYSPSLGYFSLLMTFQGFFFQPSYRYQILLKTLTTYKSYIIYMCVADQYMVHIYCTSLKFVFTIKYLPLNIKYEIFSNLEHDTQRAMQWRTQNDLVILLL